MARLPFLRDHRIAPDHFCRSSRDINDLISLSFWTPSFLEMAFPLSKFFISFRQQKSRRLSSAFRAMSGNPARMKIVSVFRNNEFRIFGFFFEARISTLGFTMTARDD
ncbi:hypothetical protein HBDW_00430 [Herbaspirillum sp. DW155]|uniref:hypothetical protein n=1 Tax=Herbaspirillum sp. DW155 TaxID=3095609 RepID=UPI00308FC1A5|nr:hypothetical protein HBDW_00430 [Herbaspirillum sp. DW155]